MTQTGRRGTVLLGLVLMMALMATPATAADSVAERMLAAGAGQAFTPAVGESSFHDSACFTDPTDDVVDLDNAEAPIDEDRADIVDFCATVGATEVVLTAAVATPTDPATDTNWTGLTTLGWFLDADGDDNGDFFALIKIEDGAPIAQVNDRSTEPATKLCDAVYGFDGTTLSITIERTCLANAPELSVSPGMIYDQRVTNPVGVAAFDTAPNDQTMTDPIAAPREGGEIPVGASRVAGGTRIETAVLGSQVSFGDGQADTVVLVRADNFPDAQVGTPLAIDRDAPLLLTASDALDPTVATEIARVTGGSGTVILVGGTAALSDGVATEIADLGYTVVRYGGVNRFATATTVASEGLGDPSTVLVSNGGDFADSVVAGAASYVAAPGDAVAAVLLTSGSDMPAETQTYLDAAMPSETIAVGGLASAALPGADRSLAGATRFETAIAVAEAFFPEPTIVGVATGLVFADALSGGALVGNPVNGPGPMLLTDPGDLPDTVADYLAATDSIESALIFGGVAAIEQGVEDEIAAAIAP